MTINIDTEKVYEKALLSKLAYEDLSETYIEDMAKQGYMVNFFDQLALSNFSKEDVEYLNNNFKILNVKNTSNTGFQAIWVEKIAGENVGEITYAIRGTNSLEDLDDDLDISSIGMATEQFIEAYNYYMRMANSQGTIINQIVEGKPENGAYLKTPNDNTGFLKGCPLT